jgi:hypothetical protein
MWTNSIKDTAVISEWQRRLSEYKAKSTWLRAVFYGGLALGAVALVALPLGWRIYVAIAMAGMLIFVGWSLSRHSYSSLKCPHCEQAPFRPSFKIRHAGDYCERCGYWLRDNEASS